MSAETQETTMFAYRGTLNRLDSYAEERYEHKPPYDSIINDLLNEVSNNDN